MSNWGNALAGAVGAVANDGAQALDAQMKDAAKADADQRAANLQLDLHSRMAAADEMMKNRAFERFAALTKQKMGEQVPVDPASIKNPALTDASSTSIVPRTPGAAPAAAAAAPAAADSSDDDEDTPSASAPADAAAGAAPAATVAVSFHGDQSATLKQMQAVVDNPKATPEQKQDAQNVIDGINAQTKKQQQLDAAGKTRPRTLKEARDAAFAEAAVSDPATYIAGQSMWKSAMANEREDASDEDKKQEKAADRTSREKIAGMQVNQRAQASADRLAAIQARVEALAGGKGARATAMMQNVDLMKSRGIPDDQINSFLLHTKDPSRAEKVIKLLSGPRNKFGDMTVDDAVKEIDQVDAATGATPAAPAKPAGKMDTGGQVRNWNPATRKFE